MVKIFTKNFSENSKLISSIIEKGNQLKESILLNFEDSFAYIFTSKVQVKFPFLWQSDDSSVPKSFFISAENLTSICALYDELEVISDSVNNSHILKNGEEEYQFSTFSEAMDLSNFEEPKNMSPENFVEIKNFDLLNLSLSIKYSDADAETSSLKAVFLRDKYIIATNKIRKFFHYKSETNLGNFDIPIFLSKILTSATNVKIYDLGNKIYFLLNNLLELVVSKETNLNLPEEIGSEDWIKKYQHETFVEVERAKLQENLRFLDSYVKDIKNHRALIEFTKDLMIINVKDNNKIRKIVPIENISEEIIGDSFWIDLTILKNIVNDLGEFQHLRIREKSSSPAVNISGFETEKDKNKVSSTNLIVVKMLME